MSNPTCPNCDHELDDDETWPSGSNEVYSGDGDISELICPNLDCKKAFHVVCHHDVNWRVCDEDGYLI